MVKLGSYEGITYWRLPRDLYRKCRTGVPGTMSVGEGRPRLTASLMMVMEPFLSNSFTRVKIRSQKEFALLTLNLPPPSYPSSSEGHRSSLCSH